MHLGSNDKGLHVYQEWLLALQGIEMYGGSRRDGRRRASSFG